MTDTGPTAAEVDRLRRARRSGGDTTVVDPVLASVVGVLEHSWASFRMRRWRAGERVDLVGAVGPGGVALLAGPPGPDVPLDIAHRPRPTAVARALAAFAGLGPAPRAESVPSPIAWEDLIATPGTVWDLAWRPGPGRGVPARLTVLDDPDGGLAEVRPATAVPDAPMMLTPRRPDEVWVGLCTLAARTLCQPGTPVPAGDDQG